MDHSINSQSKAKSTKLTGTLKSRRQTWRGSRLSRTEWTNRPRVRRNGLHWHRRRIRGQHSTRLAKSRRRRGKSTTTLRLWSRSPSTKSKNSLTSMIKKRAQRKAKSGALNYRSYWRIERERETSIHIIQFILQAPWEIKSIFRVLWRLTCERIKVKLDSRRASAQVKHLFPRSEAGSTSRKTKVIWPIKKMKRTLISQNKIMRSSSKNSCP